MSRNKSSEKTVLPPSLGGGPLGLGDPDDKRLRKAEEQFVVDKKLRKRIHKEKCLEELEKFFECTKKAGSMLMYVKCRDVSKVYMGCCNEWYTNREYVETIKNEYIEQRSQFRRTGVAFEL